jgi:hypothetical protein
MSVCKSDFDPTILGQYETPPAMLHFQWEGKKCGYKVYRYILIEEIKYNEINSRTKTKTCEDGMTQQEIRELYECRRSTKDC